MNNVIINLQICCKKNRYIPKKSDLKKWIKTVLNKKKNTNIITIRIVDETEMQYLNFTYRGKNQPTNILSFSINTFISMNYKLLGDLVLCNTIIENESLKYNKTLKSRWAHMIIHGTLHLLGYDHKNDKEARSMEAIENKILLSLNYSNPYFLKNN